MKKISKNVPLILLTCIALFALGQFHRASGSIFSPILIEQLSLSGTAIGVLTAALFLSNIAAQTPIGAALDRYGPRAMLAGGVIVAAVGTLLFAVAEDYWTLLVARILIGLGLTSGGPGTFMVIARTFPPQQFGFINGMMASFGGIGGLLGTYPLSLALVSFAWSTVFIFVTLVSLILAAVVILVIEGEPHKTEEEKANAIKAVTYKELLMMPEMRKVLALAFVTFAPITTLTGLWGGPYFQQVHMVSTENAGALLFLLFGPTTVAALIYGFLDRSVRSRKFLITLSVWISVVCLWAVALLPHPGLYLAAGLFLVMVFCQNFYIPLMAHLRKIVPASSMGRASTLLLFVAVSGIPIMQTLFGAIIDLMLHLNFTKEQAFRAAFAYMGLAILLSGLVYSRAQDANN